MHTGFDWTKNYKWPKRSDEPVLVARTKRNISLPKLMLADMKCIDCVPENIFNNVDEDNVLNWYS